MGGPRAPRRRAPAKRRYPNIEPVNDGWRATVKIDGRMRKGRKRATQEEAHEDAKRLRELRDHGRASGAGLTLRQAMDRVLARCELKGRRDGTRRWYEGQFKVLGREFGEDTKLASIDRVRVQKFINRRKREVSPNSIAHHLRALCRVFTLANLPSPTRDPDLVVPDTVPAEHHDFGWEEALRLLGRVEKQGSRVERDVLALYLYTGIRLSEGARIRVADVDFERRILHVREGKRRPRSLPCPDGLVDVLATFTTEADWKGEWLFPGDDERRRVYFVSNTFRRWAGKLNEKRLRPHAFRHTFGSELARRGVNVATIGALMGHNVGQDQITLRYLNVHAPEMLAAMACLWD